MLLPRIILFQLYICYAASGSSVFHYFQTRPAAVDDEPDDRAQNSLDSMGGAVRASIASRVLWPDPYQQRPPSTNNRFQDLYGGGGGGGGCKSRKTKLAATQLQEANSRGDSESDEPPLAANRSDGPIDGGDNSIDGPPSSSLYDFESYTVTISPTLLLNANDKNLEEKIEMHTNNHQLSAAHSSISPPPPPPPPMANGNQMTTGHQNSRHGYNTYLQPLVHLAGPGKYSSSSSASSSAAGFSSNLNLNYIHSLLAKPPATGAGSSSVAAATNSLTNLLSPSLYGGLSGAPASSPYSLASYYSSSSSSALLPSTAGNNLAQQQQQHQKHHQAASSTAAALPEGGGHDDSDLSTTAAMCGRQQVAGGSREPRIVGGNSTYEGEFPWAVSIQRHGNHHCGGVIVGRKWILTAAHCVRSQLVGNLIVRTGGNTLARSINHIGSHLERDYLVDQIVMHNDFSRYDNLTASQMKSSANTNNADIALLRLKHEIRWNELAWPVCFPPKEAGNFSGHDAVVIGWGKLNEKSEEFSNELQKVKLTIIDNKVCQNWFRQAGREMPIDDRIICAGFKSGGKDACHGDSGGPLLSKINGHYAVVGVVSTGIGCARPLLPGLYSRVSSYIGWIERHISL